MVDSVGNLTALFKKAFSATYLYPADSPILVVSGVGAWAWGAYTADFVAVNEITENFIINGVGFGTPDTNGDYTIEFYYGASDTLISSVGFRRDGPFETTIYRPLTTDIIPLNSRIRARGKHSAGGAAECYAKIYCQAI